MDYCDVLDQPKSKMNIEIEEIDEPEVGDYESFKQQFNVKEILDKLVIKREFFIPSKAKNINEFYNFEKVRLILLISVGNWRRSIW